ncbi:unnamed protein product [Hapterophycus canaliculatus]
MRELLSQHSLARKCTAARSYVGSGHGSRKRLDDGDGRSESARFMVCICCCAGPISAGHGSDENDEPNLCCFVGFLFPPRSRCCRNKQAIRRKFASYP